MGKTSQPLTIAIHPAYWNEGWVKDLMEKGHTIQDMTPLSEAHLILAPNAHFFHESWGKKELEEALRWTRKRVYPRTKKEAGTDAEKEL